MVAGRSANILFIIVIRHLLPFDMRFYPWSFFTRRIFLYDTIWRIEITHFGYLTWKAVGGLWVGWVTECGKLDRMLMSTPGILECPLREDGAYNMICTTDPDFVHPIWSVIGVVNSTHIHLSTSTATSRLVGIAYCSDHDSCISVEVNTTKSRILSTRKNKQ